MSNLSALVGRPNALKTTKPKRVDNGVCHECKNRDCSDTFHVGVR
jgi:hypothetical protein